MKKLLWSALFAASIHGAAVAQQFEVSAFGGYPRFHHPLLGSLSETPVDTDTQLRRAHYFVGVRATWNSKGYYGHELEYSVQHMAFRTMDTQTDEDGNSVSTLYTDKIKLQMISYNFLLYCMPRGERWRPFFTGGVQRYKYSAPHFDVWPGGGSGNYGFNFGGGVKIKLFPHALARLDLRERIGGRPYIRQLQFSSTTLSTGFTHLAEASVGFGIAF
ncbi:MAG: hypothetical protein ABSH05_02760 [Bryobacteraceae bacterium]|jgi:hypothetical protein